MKDIILTAELNRSRRIGVEHEFAIPLIGLGTPHQVQNQIAQILAANGLPAYARDYSHDPVDPRHVFAVERDSVEGEQRYRGITWMPIEIKTRPLAGYDEWEQVVPRMLAICNYLGGRITTACGHHIHLELREFLNRPIIARSLFNLFHRYEPVIYRLLPPSRSNNVYCLPLVKHAGLLNACKDRQNARTAMAEAGTRYNGLNLSHLFDAAGPRIELRYAAGTLDAMKARHWLRFCLQLVQHAVTRTCQAGEQVSPDRKGLDRLFTSCGFKVNSKVYQVVCPELRETAQFMLKRWRRFSPPAAAPVIVPVENAHGTATGMAMEMT